MKIIVILCGLMIMELAIPATVTVGVRVEFVNVSEKYGGFSSQHYIAMESTGVYETSSPMCGDTEDGIVCQ